ncbi:hypothetical protein [Chryseobacterium sp. BIGb0232]|uniref:hypothetical protein n=1 Tax=Chryseobacterium sp. BIGb0232 TaxID=2940598 RepID=UPI000F49CAA7|nr:hypothetical protein [Chryseobacterium sp. BIGb0232]MCS4304930.1 hypothetical protein [Chryseobacterium sp. BIGb0232]ROS09650.1 hypothetical protein EDF65_4389 [Chryseobacterium nakagawai]
MRQTAIFILSFFLCIQSLAGQVKTVSIDSISTFYNEFKTESKKNIELWNKDLYGPILLINPKTRAIFANEADENGILKAAGNVYTGVLPDKINIANTAVDWNGKRWTMIMLPLPQNKYNRVGLLAHESFHRIQPSLGFELSNAENNHLDQKEGRVYLRLELEALKKALKSVSEKELQGHLTNALTFRKYRHNLYNGSNVSENLLELNEGMAEFTGVIIGGRNKTQSEAFLVDGINDFFKNATFVRSFAYYTVPVYGYLLYNKDKNWNKKMTGKTDLTDYFIKAFNITIPDRSNNTVTKISDHYNGRIISEEETKREEKKKKLIAEYKSKLIENPHFEIKFEKMNVSFDPRNIIPIEDKGTVYPTIRVTGKWGILTVENGALMSPNWDKISISNPVRIEGEKISGDGWVLELTEGYNIEKKETNGNYMLVKSDIISGK